MTDWSRLTEYIYDYFPDPSYNTNDVEEWAKKNVPAWKYMSSRDQEGILEDWEDFVNEQEIEPQLVEIREQIGQRKPRFWRRFIRFLGRLFR